VFRGSEANAALHYLARLIEAGDLESISRRLLVIAYEDIGLASPQNSRFRKADPFCGLNRAQHPGACLRACEADIFIGDHEKPSWYALCLSPKSNSAISAVDEALKDIRTGKIGDVPKHLKDAHYKGAQELGRGIGYQYPHDFENGWVEQQYLPDPLKNKQYYKPKQTGKLSLSGYFFCFISFSYTCFMAASNFPVCFGL
jgi:putative ATPase